MKLPRICALLLLSLVSTPPVFAQGGYFGQNKVQYRDFDFKVLKTEHFDIYYYPEEEQAARMASRMAERWYKRISDMLDHELSGRQPLILYASGPHFRQTNAIQGTLGEGTGGVTEAFKRRIVLPFAGPIEATDHVLGHELVHAFQYDITNTNVSSGNVGALALPLWFIEGMAEYLSIGPVDPHTSMWMREAARREKLPTIDELNDPTKYFPYRYGQSVWAFIGGKYGDNVVGDMLRAAAGRNGNYKAAIESVLGVKTEELTKEWHGAVFDAYRPIAETTRMPGQVARGVIPRDKGQALNVSPELSPDGTKVIFFSERDLFSIDLYVADARTGKVIRKITNTATDPHFESLQFLGSAGSWDQASKRFLFPGISKGQPVLTIVDVERGRTEREVKLEGMDEVLNPAWSPDGQSVAFSGLVGGFNDLFIYDLKADKLRRLTTDAFAELDPAWSPDGRRLAFSTDRFTTNLTDIVAGDLRLAVADVASGEITQAGGFANAKNISPQWTTDGRSLYFLSDREGVTNIYRTEVGGEARQLTNLLTGVSGITALSPALSVAQNRIVFSAYENDGYSIYALESEEQLAEREPVSLPINAAVLAPRRTPEGTVYAALQDSKSGLPPADEAAQEEYKPKLTIDYAGQPSVAVGKDPFGTYAAGGISMVFSDMLGNHQLLTGIQATNRLDEIGGTVMYINKQHRWNWGALFDQTPYVLRGFEAGFTSIGGDDVYVEREIRFLQTDRTASGLFSYPISRAQRVEVTGGFRQIGFKQDVKERIYDPLTGQQIGENDQDLGSYETLNLGEASAALVYDTSINGLTSPIRGSRYRLELSQSAGTLTYSGVLGDFRTYLMPFRPFTLAFRGMFYGRFGRDSEDFRLPVLYLGYPGLVRGYDSGSFEATECGFNFAVSGACPVYDRLIGSKVGIANAELRFPLWAAFGGDNFYGPLPVEMAFFTDAGVAWDGVTRPGFGANDREPVVSVGAALRVNVFNFAIAEIDYVRPLDRPGRGWLWQFSLRPGF